MFLEFFMLTDNMMVEPEIKKKELVHKVAETKRSWADLFIYHCLWNQIASWTLHF